MKISYSKTFKKMFQKKDTWVKEKFAEKLEIFTKNIHHPLLSNHPLMGQWGGCRSINISGDYRAVYEELGNDTYEFVAIGTHSELYK